MDIYLTSDHAGFELKEKIRAHLQEKGMPVEDLGSYTPDPVNYAEFAAAVARKVSLQPETARGILVCGTGIGMAVAANKFKNVRAAVCHDEYTARLSRSHNNANVISLGGRVLQPDLALRMVDIFLETAFEAGRHAERLSFISDKIEKDNFK